MSLGKARTVGVVGSLLLLAGFVALLGFTVTWIIREVIQAVVRETGLTLLGYPLAFLLSISIFSGGLGVVLVLLALHSIAVELRYPSIFRSAVLSLVSLLIAFWGLVVMVAVVLAYSWSPLLGFLAMLVFGPSSLALLIGGVVANGFFLFRSLALTAEATGESLFRIAGAAFLARSLLFVSIIATSLAPLAELVGLIALLGAFYSLEPSLGRRARYG